MIADIFLGLVCLGLIGAFVLYVRETNREKQKLINALIARNAQETANLTFADNTKITPEVTKPDPDLIPMDQLNDEQFDEHIQATLNNQTVEQEIV